MEEALLNSGKNPLFIFGSLFFLLNNSTSDILAVNSENTKEKEPRFVVGPILSSNQKQDNLVYLLLDIKDAIMQTLEIVVKNTFKQTIAILGKIVAATTNSKGERVYRPTDNESEIYWLDLGRIMNLNRDLRLLERKQPD